MRHQSCIAKRSECDIIDLNIFKMMRSNKTLVYEQIQPFSLLDLNEWEEV